MRGFKTIALILALMLLLSGCGREKRTEQTHSAPQTPTVDAVVIDGKQDGEELQIKPIESSPPVGETTSETPAATPSQGAAATPAATVSAQASDEAVDALLQELDELGKMLDSLDSPSDADLVYPES